MACKTCALEPGRGFLIMAISINSSNPQDRGGDQTTCKKGVWGMELSDSCCFLLVPSLKSYQTTRIHKAPQAAYSISRRLSGMTQSKEDPVLWFISGMPLLKELGIRDTQADPPHHACFYAHMGEERRGKMGNAEEYRGQDCARELRMSSEMAG